LVLQHSPRTGAGRGFLPPRTNPSGKASGSVLSVTHTLAGQRFKVLNGGPRFGPTSGIDL
jgi:hypothetical protein